LISDDHQHLLQKNDPKHTPERLHLPSPPVGLPGLSQLCRHLPPFFFFLSFFLSVLITEGKYTHKQKKKSSPAGASGGGEEAGEGGNATLMQIADINFRQAAPRDRTFRL
jgi:hypothetical protein